MPQRRAKRGCTEKKGARKNEGVGKEHKAADRSEATYRGAYGKSIILGKKKKGG